MGMAAPGTFAGSYAGSSTTTLVGPGAPPMTMSQPETIVVQPSGAFQMQANGQHSAIRGNMAQDMPDGNNFTMHIPASSYFTNSGMTCSGTIVLSGNVSGNSLSGNFFLDSADPLFCNGVPMQLSGTFSAAHT